MKDVTWILFHSKWSTINKMVTHMKMKISSSADLIKKETTPSLVLKRALAPDSR